MHTTLPPHLPELTIQADAAEQMTLDFYHRLTQLVGTWTKKDVEASGLKARSVHIMRIGLLPSSAVLKTITSHRGADIAAWEEERWKLFNLATGVGFSGRRDFAWMLRNWLYAKGYPKKPRSSIAYCSLSAILNGRQLPTIAQLLTLVSEVGGSDDEFEQLQHYVDEARNRPPKDNGHNIGLQLAQLDHNMSMKQLCAAVGLDRTNVVHMLQGYHLPTFTNCLLYARVFDPNWRDWAERWHAARDAETRLQGAFGDIAKVGDGMRRSAQRIDAQDGTPKIITVNLKSAARSAGLAYTTVSAICNGKKRCAPRVQASLRQQLNKMV